MFFPTKPLLLLLPTFLCLFSTFFSFSHGAAIDHLFPHLQPLHDSPDTLGVGEHGVVLRAVRRSSSVDVVVVVQKDGERVYNNTSLVLAADRARRKDPLNDFNYYTGGWNISEQHYISSVAFTAAPLFIIAAVWFIGFALCLLLLGLCYCCCHRRSYGYSRTAYALSLIILALFTIAAIIGCVVLYTGQGKFHDGTQDTLDYVVRQAQNTVKNLRNVSSYLVAAKKIGVDQIFLPSDVQNNIDMVQTMISTSASTLEGETKKNSNDIQGALDTVRLILIVIAAAMLLLAFLGFFLSVLGLQFLVYFLVILGWILITATFILCGVFVVLHNVTGDTCVAMDQWVQNPTAHTALDDIIPCVDNATAQETLSQSKDVIFQLAGVVNQIIINVSNVNFPPNAGPFFYNQSGPLVPALCNPFNPDQTDRICAAGEVDLSNATQVWTNYVCQVSSSNICTTVGRLTPDMYSQMSSAVNVSYGLYSYSPFLVGLLDCSFVRETFTGISNDHCPDLRQYSKWIYIGLAMVSTAVMLSLIFWVLYARERRHRKYTKLVDARSAQSSFEHKGP